MLQYVTETVDSAQSRDGAQIVFTSKIRIMFYSIDLYRRKGWTMCKKLLRIGSLVLALVILLQNTSMLDVAVYAAGSIKETADNPVAEAEIIGEDISKREESVKHFKMSDGSWLAASYPDVVHYKTSEGDWVEIDNTLHAKTLELSVPMAAVTGGEMMATFSGRLPEGDLTVSDSLTITDSSLVNFSNSFGVSLPSNLNTQSWVGTFHENYSLYFRFENIGSADACVGSSTAPGDMNDVTLVNTYSSVMYDNVLPGVDIAYELIGQQLKESILFDRLEHVPDSISFVVWAKDLELEAQEDGSFIFLAGEKPRFIIPAPFMMDSDGESGGSVEVVTEEISDDIYRFTYVPNRQWLQSSDRVWPVILDPVTCAVAHIGTIKDTYVRLGYPNNTYYNAYRFYAGYYSAPTKAVRSLVQHTALPVLNSGDVITKAEFQATGHINEGAGDIQVNAYANIEDWHYMYIQWLTQPAIEEDILDFQIINGAEYKTYSWDITSAAQRWYAGDVAGKGPLENYGIMLKAPAAEEANVINSAEFISSESSGTKPQLLIYYRNTTGIESYWDYTSADATRAGTVSVNDYTGNLVVSRTDMAYSGNRMPANILFTYNANDNFNNIGYGNGWRSNYSQTLKLVTISDNNYYCWIDGDGTRIYFYNDEGIWRDENGLEYTLMIEDAGISIQDRDGNKLSFDANGYLTEIIDGKSIGNKIQITYCSGAATPKISQVTDGAGRKYNFTYGNDGNLSVISYTGTTSEVLESVSYTYSYNQLTKVTYADNNSAAYTYDGGYLVSAVGCQNKSVTIEYSTGIPAKVKKLTSKDGSETVGSASFIYGDNYTKVTDNNKRWCIYQFNNMGNTVSVYNRRGQALYGNYSDSVPNQLVNSSRLQDTVTNLLSTRSHSESWSQTVPVTEGESYTLSGTGTGTLTLTAGDVSHISDNVDDARTEVTVTVPSGVTNLTASGSGGFRDLQLEQTEAASRYNMLYDTDMTSVSSWSGIGTAAGDGQTDAEGGSRAHLDKYSLAISGDGSTAKQYTQTLTCDGRFGDCYSFGVWVKASSVALDNSSVPGTESNRRFGVWVRLLDGSKLIKEEYIAANEACAEWQFISGSVQATGAYDTVEYSLVYNYNANTAYFDGAQLFKERFAYTYAYDDNGRVASVTDLAGKETKYSYRGTSSDIALIELPGDVAYTYHYNDNNLLTGITSATGIQTTYTYDSYGNNIQTTIGRADNSAVIQSNQTYTDDGNFLKTATGGDRNTVTYNYDTDKSTLTSVTDAKGNVTSNTYDSMRRLQSTTSGDATVSYTYNKDRLSSITHSGGTNGTTYNFTYTTAGLSDKVSVGSGYTLVDNAYNSNTWTLVSQTYGNGDVWCYTYNEFDDLVSAYTTGGSTGTELKYFYNSEGALARIEQFNTELSDNSISSRTLVSTERCYYDTTDRMIRIVRIDADGDTYECSWEYDHNNNVTLLMETINGTPTTTAYTYDDDQRIASVSAGGTTTTYEYDWCSRIGKQVTNSESNTNVLEKTFFYWVSDDSPLTSTQVTDLVIESSGLNVTYVYNYDANGNIITIGINDGQDTLPVSSYVYDALNQLTRENNKAAEKTWVWTYDTGGNITSRKEYSYTEGDLGDPISTVNYTYGDDSWGDLLTAYNGTVITHDGMGNPLNDGTWAYTWAGRQLEFMTSGDTTWNYKYDADGLRTERSNGTATYEYVYSGDSLVHMSVGTNLLYFTYDGSGPMTVTYNGTAYYYVTNLQGDVIAILDGSGNPVVEYTYDAWGKLLSTTGTLAETLGVHNPLRYRGYVYDTETTLYYLQSRYYDPKLGRFLNADAFTSTGQGTLGNNMFAYCLNNPVNRIDWFGNASIWYYLIVDHDMGFIHRLVQGHIVASYGSSYSTEVVLEGFGRADIVDTKKGHVWEVKHAGQFPEARACIAKVQALKYIGGSNGNTTITALGAAHAFSGSFYIQCMAEQYHVSYNTPTEGAILYSVQKVDNQSGEVFAVYAPKKQYENCRGNLALGMVGFVIGYGGRFDFNKDIACDMACAY